MHLTIVRTLCATLCLGSLTAAQAEDLNVVSSGGFATAYKTLGPKFEQTTGNKLHVGWGPSMGDTPNAVPVRLQRGEDIDVVIMVGYALGNLIKEGKVLPTSRVDLAHSGIGVVVQKGAPHPDVSTPEALRKTLLAAKSIAYSDSASGVYISTTMFKKMGIADEVAGKARMIPATPVGEIVAKGEAEIGFQQISELKPIQGIELLGPLPGDLQQDTVFSGGVVASSKHPKEAQALLQYLSSKEAQPAVIDSGLTPMDSQ